MYQIAINPRFITAEIPQDVLAGFFSMMAKRAEESG